ncbi:Unknown protein [Striga hermonthica]|uniref:Transposase n=1 Tax=Striga hermonthica TaxID=68872 RepID=A0A9N7R4I9_STRHE|nr:Unknown protein [Striga hermonthica]
MSKRGLHLRGRAGRGSSRGDGRRVRFLGEDDVNDDASRSPVRRVFWGQGVQSDSDEVSPSPTAATNNLQESEQTQIHPDTHEYENWTDWGQSSDSNSDPEIVRRRGPNSGTIVPTDESKRMHISVEQNRFLNPEVPRDITATLKAYLNGPYPTYKHVPGATKDALWKKFNEKFKWSPGKTEKVRRAFNRSSAERLKGMFNRARSRAMKLCNGSKNPKDWVHYAPGWLDDEYWQQIIDKHWANEKYEMKCKIAKQNRETTKGNSMAKHTGGSIPFVAHRKQMEMKKKGKVTQSELFARTHKRQKGTGDYVDDKSKDVSEKYKAALEAKYGPDMLDEPMFDADAWAEATNGPHRGRIYGFTPAEGSLVSENDGNNDDVNEKLKAMQEIIDELTKSRVEVEKEIRQELAEKMASEIAEMKRQSKEEIVEIKLGMKRRAKRHRKEMGEMIRNMLRDLNLPNSKYPSGSGTK